MSDFTKLISTVCLLASLPALQSCVYEDMSGCSGNYMIPLAISNDWRYAPDAEPAGMAYFFFPDDGGRPWRFDTAGKDGGDVKVPDRVYSLVAVNDDFSTVVLENADSFGGISVTTGSCQLFDALGLESGRAGLPPSRSDGEGMPCQDVRYSPDMLWTDAVAEVHVSPGYLSYTLPDGHVVEETCRRDSHKLCLIDFPMCIVSRYHVRIEKVGNLGGVAMMSGAVSGLASSVRLADGTPSAEAVTVPLRLEAAGIDSIEGDFLTFGRAAGPDAKNMLGLYVWLKDGSRHNYVFDVTGQVLAADDPMDVWITLKDISLPESGPASGSFDVNVDDWHTVVINLST